MTIYLPYLSHVVIELIGSYLQGRGQDEADILEIVLFCPVSGSVAVAVSKLGVDSFCHEPFDHFEVTDSGGDMEGIEALFIFDRWIASSLVNKKLEYF